MLRWFVWISPRFSPGSPGPPCEVRAHFETVEVVKNVATSPGPCSAHRPALLDTGAVGARPNPLQAKRVNAFHSAVRAAVEGANGEQQVAGGGRFFTWRGLVSSAETGHVLLERSHDNSQCLKFSTWTSDFAMLW